MDTAILIITLAVIILWDCWNISAGSAGSADGLYRDSSLWMV